MAKGYKVDDKPQVEKPKIIDNKKNVDNIVENPYQTAKQVTGKFKTSKISVLHYLKKNEYSKKYNKFYSQ